MIKRLSILIFLSLFPGYYLNSQVIFSDSFGNLNLQTYTSGSISTQYTTASGIYSYLNDGYGNNVGPANNPNVPFNVPALKTSGWAVVYNANVNDTFLVSTSWLDSSAYQVDRSIITPTVSNIGPNTVLTWLAMSPDPTYRDGYYVYGTNNTGSITIADFTIGNQLFALPDNNTPNGGENTTWTRRSIYLGSFAGQTLRFAFRNLSKDRYQLWVDDIEIKNVSNNVDAAIVNIETPKYSLINAADTISVKVSNLGASNISSITLNYQYGNSSVNSQDFAPASGVPYLEASTFTFGIPYSISTPGYYRVKSWISAVNGVPDQDHSNDTIVTYVTIQASAPQKNLLVEQFVSAFDGESADARDKAQALQNYNVVVVNIHDSDSLKEANSSGALAYRKQFSTAMMDRVYYDDLSSNTVDRYYYISRATRRLHTVTPASVSIINKSFDPASRLLSFTVKADFVGEVHGDYRLNAYLIENNVYGPVNDTTTANGFNQLSNYYNVPYSPYYQLGTFSPAQNSWVLSYRNFMHLNTLVHSFDGSFGNAGLIPTTGGTQGQSYQTTYTLTVPTPTNGAFMFNPDNLYIVGFVAEYNADIYQRNILNVVKDKITGNVEIIGIKENQVGGAFSIYPNPSSGKVYFKQSLNSQQIKVKVLDVLGKTIKEETLNPGTGAFEIDLSSFPGGVYFIQSGSGQKQTVEKVILQKN